MIRTQIQLSEEQYRALKEAARCEDVSLAAIVRRCVDRWLAEQQEGARRERADRALAVVGRFASGSDDVAERHDAYLCEDLS